MVFLGQVRGSRELFFFKFIPWIFVFEVVFGVELQTAHGQNIQ
jgi:hypothetical protein